MTTHRWTISESSGLTRARAQEINPLASKRYRATTDHTDCGTPALRLLDPRGFVKMSLIWQTRVITPPQTLRIVVTVLRRVSPVGSFSAMILIIGQV